MKKEERQELILNMLERDGQVTVNEIMHSLSVSDMTIRRDLNELALRGQLIRTHGGARPAAALESGYERSHMEKKSLHKAEKKIIAQTAAAMIHDGETVFLGPGTTLEQLAVCLRERNIRVVTNSLPVFEILKGSSSADLILTGGEYRENTGAFIGTVAVRAIENMRFAKAFISVNGIAGGAVYTYSEEEGYIQKQALNNAAEKILLADSSKFNAYDFYEFYPLADFDHIITDSGLEGEVLTELKETADVRIAGDDR